jgi:hypothetical protein
VVFEDHGHTTWPIHQIGGPRCAAQRSCLSTQGVGTDELLREPTTTLAPTPRAIACQRRRASRGVQLTLALWTVAVAQTPEGLTVVRSKGRVEKPVGRRSSAARSAWPRRSQRLPRPSQRAPYRFLRTALCDSLHRKQHSETALSRCPDWTSYSTGRRRGCRYRDARGREASRATIFALGPRPFRAEEAGPRPFRKHATPAAS